MNSSKAKNNERAEKLSVGFLLLQGMAAMYNREAYTQDLVFEFNFLETGETIQLQVFRNECKVTTTEMRHYTVRLETSLQNMQKIADFTSEAKELPADSDCRVKGDETALHRLPLLFSSRTQPQQTETRQEKNGARFILHAPVLALWIGLLFHEFWGGILILLIALSCAKIFIKNKTSALNYVTTAVGIIAGLLCIINQSDTMVFSLTYILLGIIWGLSCLSRTPLLLSYLEETFHTGKLAPESLVNGGRILTAVRAAAYIALGIVVYLFHATYDNTGLIGISVIVFAVIWFITRHTMVLYYRAEPKENHNLHQPNQK